MSFVNFIYSIFYRNVKIEVIGYIFYFKVVFSKNKTYLFISFLPSEGTNVTREFSYSALLF